MGVGAYDGALYLKKKRVPALDSRSQPINAPRFFLSQLLHTPIPTISPNHKEFAPSPEHAPVTVTATHASHKHNAYYT